ncbi:MAG: hypothetical protein QM751_05760 [Paludibacteraceae bacterium]
MNNNGKFGIFPYSPTIDKETTDIHGETMLIKFDLNVSETSETGKTGKIGVLSSFVGAGVAINSDKSNISSNKINFELAVYIKS